MLRIALALILIPLLGSPCLAEDKPASNARITLKMKDAELVEVITAIANAAKANVIMSPKVSGRVSIDVRDVHWLQALKQTARARGFFVAEEEFGIFRVFPREERPLEQDYYRFQRWRPRVPKPGPGVDPALAMPAALRACVVLLQLDDGNLRYIPQENAAIFIGSRGTVRAMKLLLAALDHAAPAAESGVPPRVKRGPPPPRTDVHRRYEELLRDAKTETAAKYFVDRLGELRAAKPKKKNNYEDLYGKTAK